MDNIQIFKNQEFGQVRTVSINNEPYFIGKDVAEILGYSDTFGAIKKHVDIEDKQNCQNDSFESNRGLTIINESGLYSLILSSKLPSAKKFKKWVTGEVLPSIRKTGGYLGTNEEMTDSEIMAKALMVAQKTIDSKSQMLKAKEQELLKTKEDLESKNKFINQLAISENSLLVREVAKIASKNDISIGEKRLWNKLRDWGIIFKTSTEPKQLALDKGYVEVVEGSKQSGNKVFTYHTTRITGKGQAYIINKLLKEREEM